MIARLVRMSAAMLMSLATPALAQAGKPDPWAGTWALEAEGHPIMLLTLAKEGANWHSTARWLTWRGDFDRVADVDGPAKTDVLNVVSIASSAAVLAQPDRETIALKLLSPDILEWRYDDSPMPPLVLRRASPRATLAAAVDRTRSYAVDRPWPDNAAMTRLFDADQADRKTLPIDWTIVGPADKRRQAETQALLDADALHSGTDFWHAAFVFQHGAAPADYLKAHALAVIAASRGRRDAAWIAAATLDRYLQKIGQKQVYGTQFQTAPGVPATQEPYDRTTLSDGLRRATGVPTLAEQETQRADHDKPGKP